MDTPNAEPGNSSAPAEPRPTDSRPPRERNDRERSERDRGGDRERGGDRDRDRGDRERIQSFEQMKVWQESHGLVLRIFEVTPRIPPEQQEGLAMMMEKAAVEVPKSIAEGFKRRGSRNKAHYYNLAQSSLEALRYMLILGRDLKFDVDFDDLWTRSEQVSRMLDGLVRSMARSNRGDGGDRRGGRGGRVGRGGGGRGRSREDPIGEEPASVSDDEWDDE
jgi:four helix bundle protein